MFGAPKLLEPFMVPGMTETLDVLLKDSNIIGATINNSVFINSQGRTTRIDVGVTVKEMPAQMYKEAEQIGTLALDNMPAAKEKDLLAVTITHGYSIGIAYYRKSYTYAGSAIEWEKNPGKVTNKAAQTIQSAGIGK